MSDIEQQSLRYLLARGDSPQWGDFMRALSDELATQLGTGELRSLFHALGRRIASGAPLPGSTVSTLQRNINDWLFARGWGWIQIHDREEWLDFEHACGPLRAAFGEAALRWTGALLEGLYAGWLKAAGADESLNMRQIGEASGPCDVLQFRFAHHKVFA